MKVGATCRACSGGRAGHVVYGVGAVVMYLPPVVMPSRERGANMSAIAAEVDSPGCTAGKSGGRSASFLLEDIGDIATPYLCSPLFLMPVGGVS